METGTVLLHLVAVFVAARIAAEIAERLRQPAVLTEIIAGLLIGPAALRLVGNDDVVRTLGELGVLLLLFEVGRQMDLADLARVGGSSLRVAGIGIVAPMALGFAAMRALGLDGAVAVFLAGGITATSVGITARVFADLHALSSAEARTVLGAAVADDVAGLLVLTVVIRATTGGALQPTSLAVLILIALGFLAVATLAGTWVAPPALRLLESRARTHGTVMVLALAFALALARLAEAAKLAPIVGAFVAGVAVSRSDARADIHRALAPIGHLLIPIFFLQIGIDTKLQAFAEPRVLGIAAVLCVVAIAGKLIAGLGVARGGGDRLLVGAAMIPRGEVGLIFAGLGLRHGILGQDSYAVLVLVVLVTTLLTPPYVRRLVQRTRRRAVTSGAAARPDGGWLRQSDGEIELIADPPAELAPDIGLQAALACSTLRPGPRLVAWLGSAAGAPPSWDAGLRERLLAVLRDGTERSWRFLETTGLLAWLLPELGAAVRRRGSDPFELDPGAALRWSLLEDLKAAVHGGDRAAAEAWERLSPEARDVVMLAALARDAFQFDRDPRASATRFAATLGCEPVDADHIGFLVRERHLLPAAASRHAASGEEAVLDLAAHVADLQRAESLYVLAVAEDAIEPWEREGLDELHAVVREALAHPELTGPDARDLVQQRRASALVALSHLPDAEGHLNEAPRRYILAQSVEAIARHLRMIETRPARDEARLEAVPSVEHRAWTVHVAALDRPGLLAHVAGALALHGVSVENAHISTWRSEIAIDVFDVMATDGVDWESVRRALETSLASGNGLAPAAPIEGAIEIDNRASPWHTVVAVRAGDREGLLYRVASALSRVGVQIHRATVTTGAGLAVNTFWVTGHAGGKLDALGEQVLRAAFAGGTVPRRRKLLRPRTPVART